ncbi:MAG: hypothetical protein JWP76_5499, partial [Dactylosporangium sp.]|nr:hypothetical protein [Dactylosporangium sp.]
AIRAAPVSETGGRGPGIGAADAP